ncbi:MAG: hypothetical protein PHS32_20935 [Rhodoferax sp.]|uniref:hypothetical protein n=1 Tax=Rhodoferax sp. TaxID=50421 RepID=UPI00262E97F8|nr:hypothetical protein [Rhodoferax sp.]MDD5336209.1 hypothetical protein [Rhodoferax sp.]
MSFFTWIFLGFVLAAVSAEVRALLDAWALASTYHKPQFRVPLFWLRYQFNSVCFHEIFAYKRRVKPAYRLSTFLMLHGVVVFTAVLTTGARGNAQLMEVLGLGCVVGGVFFAAQYGRAFSAHRELVARLTAKGNPLLFADL